MFSILYD